MVALHNARASPVVRCVCNIMQLAAQIVAKTFERVVQYRVHGAVSANLRCVYFVTYRSNRNFWGFFCSCHNCLQLYIGLHCSQDLCLCAKPMLNTRPKGKPFRAAHDTRPILYSIIYGIAFFHAFF